jgi:hypothetical protein
MGTKLADSNHQLPLSFIELPIPLHLARDIKIFQKVIPVEQQRFHLNFILICYVQ